MSSTSEDEAAIRRYIEGINDAFNRGDAKAIAATYAPDAAPSADMQNTPIN